MVSQILQKNERKRFELLHHSSIKSIFLFCWFFWRSQEKKNCFREYLTFRRASQWHILCAQKELEFLLEEGQAETSSKDVYVARQYLKLSLKFWAFMLQKCLSGPNNCVLSSLYYKTCMIRSSFFDRMVHLVIEIFEKKVNSGLLIETVR